MHKSLRICEFTALFIGIPREWQCLGCFIFRDSAGGKALLRGIHLDGLANEREAINKRARSTLRTEVLIRLLSRISTLWLKALNPASGTSSA